ncbi:snare-complex protein syntaxin-18 N-terminus-domain-containing protein [Naematelia encephala]|uniref:Snare-complex protein syntaxin-18 N-terminus-domain-containing protein n=1 Tax=Naematelia encephala TaxID=71784 RepID=A0A1Y2B1T3_9TREE|nr:snare-complex protein syntaxin-18 N-terminus-domain-containing protein [Naematelia encephala]
MVYNDHTAAFRDILGESSSRTASLTPPRSRSPRPSQPDEFLKEAYRIYEHLTSLNTLLASIRKPYLSLTTQPPLSRRPRPAESNDNEAEAEGQELRKWQGSKYLSDRERDEIDLRGKMILRTCRERVGILEESEKGRHKAAPTPSSIFHTLLPSLTPTSTSTTASTLLSAHRASILWTLDRLLATTSQTMTNMQEERSKRRDERSRTLGGQAAREVAILQARAGPSNPAVETIISPDDEPPIEDQLSPEQLQEFASENSALLSHMEQQLSSVLSAEKSLLEISAMQTELVRHLVQQTEITDRLYDEAVGSVSEVTKANEQLKTAKRRGEEGRLFLLVFLVGASLGILFLDWYS